MAQKTMLILRGNKADTAGSYPDAQGKAKAWPFGALHEQKAIDYATKRLNYDKAIVSPVSGGSKGDPQSEHSAQSQWALKTFHEDETVTGFYGFSGGGYNLWHILKYLAENEPQSLHRIKWVVAVGAPNTKYGGQRLYEPARYNDIARKKVKDWEDVDWDVIYRKNPLRSRLPSNLPKNIDTHMFGPDVLLSGWPEGEGTP